MSCITFGTPSRDVRLRGSERAWMGVLTADLAVGMLHLRDHGRRTRLKSLIHPDHSLSRHHVTDDSMPWDLVYDLTLTQGGWADSPPLIQYGGKRIDEFELVLNSALTVGSDAVRLAARLHGQCETHAWVDGPDRAWLADVIVNGLADGVFRTGIWHQSDLDPAKMIWNAQGWDDVTGLLRENDTEPVVTSYSVTDDFPSVMIGDWMPSWPDGVPMDFTKLDKATQKSRQDRQAAWFDLSDEEQWRISLDGLRAMPGGLQLTPDGFQSFRFGHGLSVLDLFAGDWETRVREALGIPNEDHERQ